MKLEFVEKVPERRADSHNLQALIEAFCNSESKAAKINFDKTDYKSAQVAYTCMTAAVRRSRHPVKVSKRGDSIYLIKVL